MKHIYATLAAAALSLAPVLSRGQPPAPALAAIALPLVVCPYCIRHLDVGVPVTGGAPVVLVGTMLRTESDVNNVSVQTPSRPQLPARPQPLAALTPYLPWHDSYEVSQFIHGQHPAWVPMLIPLREGVETWAPLVTTAHVCLGSTFQVPTHYFRGKDKLPMASFPPGTLSLPGGALRSVYYRDLPSLPFQTICEGELKPVEDLLKTYVQGQLSPVLKTFAASTTTEKLQEHVKKAVDDWMAANGNTVAADAAALVDRGAR